METPQEQSRFAQWGPYLGALGIALVAGALFLGIFLPIPRNILLGLGGLGVLLFALFVVSRPRAQVREAVTGRTAVYGSNTIILVIAFIGIVVLINFLASRQFHSRTDLTANKQYTLSQQTIQVLQSLKEPIQVTGFFTPQSASSKSDAQNELKEYQQHSSELQVKFIDPQANPAAAQSYNIAQDATLVFARGSRQEKVYSFDESTLTNAILKVTQTQQPAVYFTTGHGEINPTDTGQTGMSNISDFLQQTNYKVEVLNLAAITATQTISGGLPADISALVIAGPTKPFAPQDEQRVKTYLDNGGRVLLLVDPGDDPGLHDLLASNGITLTNDLILDPAQNYRGNPPIPVITSFPTHAVTQNLSQYGVFFPGVRSLKEGDVGKTATALFTTSDQACGKTDLAALQTQQQLQCDPAKDEKGPFTLGYAVESSAAGTAAGTPSRLIVIGSANFATNQWVQNPDSNGDRLLIGNIVNWLAGQEQLIAIPPKSPGTTPLNTLTGTDVNFMLWSNIALLPLASLIIGGLIWWRRR